jgi:DNA-binding Lrp family transcriptional regulator
MDNEELHKIWINDFDRNKSKLARHLNVTPASIRQRLKTFFNSRRITISNEEIYNKWINNYKRNTSALAKELKVTETAIRKRMKKYCQENNLVYNKRR